MNASPHLELEDLVAEANGEAVADHERRHLALCRECRTEADRWSSVAAGVRELTGTSSPLPRLRLSSRQPMRRTPRRALAMAAAVTALAIGGVTYALAGSPRAGAPAPAIGLSAVNGCPGLAAALGIVERTATADLVIRTPGGQPVPVTLPGSAKVSREKAAPIGDLTSGTRVFVRGVFADGRVVARSITIGVPSKLPASAFGWRAPSPRRPWIGAGTVRNLTGNTFVLVVRDGRTVAITTPASAAIYSLTRTTRTQLRPGDYVVAVGKPGPGGSLIAATVEAGNALPHNRSTGIAGLRPVGCKPSTIAAAAFVAGG